jgi:ribonuclease HI
MELTALIEALKHIRDNELHEQYDIEIFCDSQYVVNGVNSWWKKWKANGFRTTTGIVKNLELWKQIEGLRNEVDCQLTWVKGHAQNEKHNEVDRLVFNLTDTSRKNS